MVNEENHAVEATALFPWFVTALGVVTFLFQTRYFSLVPYTGMMFLLGTVMGVVIGTGGHDDEMQLSKSISQWASIHSGVLLLVFLPGLVFRDSLRLDSHLLSLSISQTFIFAFPMVLAGTTLTALVAFYVFPYNWSFNFSMAFGAILSATDPVAVNALLNEVGAPPRLKIHIASESLFNDGSSIVFYSIFSAMYLHELDIKGVGESFNLTEGFQLFLKEAIGGAAIGIAFGCGLALVIYLLNRRLNSEENAVQVSATVAMAYLTYYVADVVLETSGVLAVVLLGITTNILGNSMINDGVLMRSFWTMLDHILNTILFSLGGVLWGSTISNSRQEKFVAVDWGYLVVLYIFLMLIRFLLMAIFFPLCSRIGLKSSRNEAIFMSFGGLRGAVGIALAISLDSEVRAWTDQDDESREWTHTLFGMVGGIALMTLLINGTLSAPLLEYLELTDTSGSRKLILRRYRRIFERQCLDELVRRLTDVRFRNVDIVLVKAHVPPLWELTLDEFTAAVERNKANVAPCRYKAPFVDRVMRSFDFDDHEEDEEDDEEEGTEDDSNSRSSRGTSLDATPEDLEKSSNGGKQRAAARNGGKEGAAAAAATTTTTTTGGGRGGEKISSESFGASGVETKHEDSDTKSMLTAAGHQSSRHRAHKAKSPRRSTPEEGLAALKQRDHRRHKSTLIELRKLFIQLLRACYQEFIDTGELDGREAFTTYLLMHSLDFAADAACKGEPLSDWACLETLVSSLGWWGGLRVMVGGRHRRVHFDVHRALACVGAHERVQERFLEEHSGVERDVYLGERHMCDLVIQESNEQKRLALSSMEKFKRGELEAIVSHLLCTTLLNSSAKFVESFANTGFLRETEASGFLQEIEATLKETRMCEKHHKSRREHSNSLLSHRAASKLA